MSRPRLVPLLSLALLVPGLSGCVVGTVAGAAVGVAATTVKTGVKVTGAAVGVAADGVGAVAKTATGSH